MSTFTIVVGNKNYSSWSLRPWLALKHTGVPFDEIVEPLFEGDYHERLLAHSPSAKVPVLKHNGLVIWDSLAICEYLVEQFPGAGLWPEDAAERAHARSISAEMHSGFTSLRGDMAMNMRTTQSDHTPGPGVTEDISRVTEIWNECRAKQADVGGGPFLFGQFTIADAMYAPVASRFRTYGIALDPVCADYVNTIHALPAFTEWYEASVTEPYTINMYENQETE
jgi:glutathione S-transferase